MLVVDANVAVWAVRIDDGFAFFGREQLVAPRLLWSEAWTALHEASYRGDITRGDARARFERLERAPLRARDHRRLGPEAWKIADEFGWARTYDAEYVALAVLLRCRLVTLDGRLRRGADRLGIVVGPDEL